MMATYMAICTIDLKLSESVVTFLVEEYDGTIGYTTNRPKIQMCMVDDFRILGVKYEIIVNDFLSSSKSIQPGQVMGVIYETDTYLLCILINSPHKLREYRGGEYWCIKSNDNDNDNEIFLVGVNKQCIDYSKIYTSENLEFIKNI